MESKKVSILQKMLEDARKRDETIIITMCEDILPLIKDVTSDREFEDVVFLKIQAMADAGTTLLKKKETVLAERQIYCITLLSHMFFNRLIEANIEGKKVVIKDKRF